jgi:hypothetical protein
MPVIESAIDEIDMQTPPPPLSSQNSYKSHINFMSKQLQHDYRNNI